MRATRLTRPSRGRRVRVSRSRSHKVGITQLFWREALDEPQLSACRGDEMVTRLLGTDRLAAPALAAASLTQTCAHDESPRGRA